jgi:hypothetical protein
MATKKTRKSGSGSKKKAATPARLRSKPKKPAKAPVKKTAATRTKKPARRQAAKDSAKRRLPAKTTSARKAPRTKPSARNKIGKTPRTPARKTVSAKSVELAKASTATKPRANKLATPMARPPVATITHVVFGDLRVDPANCIYWEKKLAHGDREISVSLTVGDASDATPEILDRSATFVTRMTAFDAQAREHLRQSQEQDPDSAVALYRTHHLDELSEESVTRIFGKAKDAVATEDFFRSLFLHRVGLYPSSAGGSATFDYTLGANETDYVLAVTFDEDGTVVGVEMES